MTPGLLATRTIGLQAAPFSAEAVSESVQTLFDGNRIVRSSTSKIYRNGEGRIRRELDKGAGGFAAFSSFEPMVTIADPLGVKTLLDAKERIATTITQLPMGTVNIIGTGNMSAEEKEKIKK